MITGTVALTGNPSGTTTLDQVLNNQFQGGTLTLTSDDGSAVQSNTFNDSGNVAAITVTSSQNVGISNNSITITGGGGALTGPVGIAIGGAASGATSVNVFNNSLSTSGTGRGVVLGT